MSRAPYKYLDYYTFEDADLFFGREEETQRMVGEILSTRLLVLFSPSGSGKTSLINAGVRPQLENMGYQTIYTRLETEPISSVCNAVTRALEIPCHGNTQSLYEFLKSVTSRTEKPLVIFLDQFEEFFTVFREQREKRKEFIDQLAKIKYDDQLPVFVVLSLREDYFVNLHEFREAIPSIFQNNANLRLEPFTDEEARRAIVKPLQAKDIDVSIENELVNKLINDLKDSQPGIKPIKLQIVCHTLWEKKVKEADQISLADYQACESASTILRHHVQILLNKIPKRQHGFMVRIFEALKTEEDTKRFRSFGELQKELKIKKPERLAKMLDRLSDIRLLRYEEKERTKWYEFKHDYLVGEIIKWIRRRNDQIRAKRFRYAIAPGIVLALVLFVWALFEFNRFEARFTDQKYAEQQQEVFVKRRFNPFGFRVTTGILDEQLKDLEAKNAIKNGFIISVARSNDWTRLTKIMYPVSDGIFLYHIGKYEAGIDSLLISLNDQDSDVRSRAAGALGNLDQANDQAIAALLVALNDQSWDVRYQATTALVNLDQADDQVIFVMLDALKDQKWNVRYQAADALGNLGQVNDQVIAALLGALNDQVSFVRYRVVGALVNLGQSNEQVITALLCSLNDQDSSVRSQAARTLVNLDQADDQVISALLGTLKDQSPDVRCQAAGALGNLGVADDNVIAALLGVLYDQFSVVRYQAAGALGNLGKVDDNVIAALVAALNDQDSDVRSQAAGALGKLLPFNSKKKLFEYLTDKLSGFRTAGAQALARQDSITDSILEEVNRLKNNDERPWVRLGAWEAYELIQKRLADEKTANQFIHYADSLFQINKFLTAEDEYQSAFNKLSRIIRIDSLKIARTKFKQARCTARMKRLVPTLDHLEIAFQYNKAWRDTLRAELAQKESEWEFMKENWYLNEVLLKNSKPQITNHK